MKLHLYWISIQFLAAHWCNRIWHRNLKIQSEEWTIQWVQSSIDSDECQQSELWAVDYQMSAIE